jgi:hypothetical protein
MPTKTASLRVSVAVILLLSLIACGPNSIVLILGSVTTALDIVVAAVQAGCSAHQAQCLTPEQVRAIDAWAVLVSDSIVKISDILHKKEAPAQEAVDIVTVLQAAITNVPVGLPPTIQADIQVGVSLMKQIIALYEAAKNEPPSARANATVSVPDIGFVGRRRVGAMARHAKHVREILTHAK